MATVTLRGNPFNTNGELPDVGSAAPDFVLTGSDLGDITLESLAGQKVILNISPSIDTATCATSVRTFNERAAAIEGTVVLYVSEDLPFAQNRFCGAEGIENVKTASAFRGDFTEAFGLKLMSGPMRGLAARAVVVIDESGNVLYTQLVGEITDEPDYDAALSALD
jgi:thioredoxin-dependent peroxiredoxin